MRLPSRFVAVILAFAPVFLQQRTWHHAELLLIGAILAPGKRTVTSLLRITGLGRERRFANHHRVLNRVAWSPRAASRVLLGLLLDAFAPTGPVVLGIDDTIERRRGGRINAKGIYRDPVRSSRGHFVKASGLRWLSLMLLAPIPWAERTWALPFLTALAPSERYCRERGRRHKKLTDWARRMALQARRWLPGREVVLVGDSGFAALELLAALARHGLICVTRLRLDAALYEPAPATVPGWYGEGARVVEVCSATAVWRHAGLPVVPIRWVLLRDPRARFEPQALLCTDPARDPLQIVRWFVRRWQVEVTFREARDHLGVETQRQWSDRAIARTTPCLLALFSLVTLLAAHLGHRARLRVSASAWYRKKRPTFSDTLAAVRRQFWFEQGLLTSRHSTEPAKLRPALREGIAYVLCHAA